MEPLRAKRFDTVERKARLARFGVVLEEVEATAERFKGTLCVANFGYEKYVYVRYSGDSWATHCDVKAAWSGTYAEENFDTFTFAIEWPKTEGVKEVEFALCCEQNETSYWDNNDGKNYLVSFKPPVKPKTDGRQDVTTSKKEVTGPNCAAASMNGAAASTNGAAAAPNEAAATANGATAAVEANAVDASEPEACAGKASQPESSSERRNSSTPDDKPTSTAPKKMSMKKKLARIFSVKKGKKSK